MPMALTGRCIVAYLATRCRCAESDCASRAAWPATAQPLVSHHSPMALVDMSGEEVPGGVPAPPCRGQGCNDLLRVCVPRPPALGWRVEGGVAGGCGSLPRAQARGPRKVRERRRHDAFDHGQRRKLAWQASIQRPGARPRCARLSFERCGDFDGASDSGASVAQPDLCPLTRFHAKCSSIGR